jgi:hypothetical protein
MEKRFIGIYDVERMYGGPEEGGWYYNWNTWVASIPVLKDRRESAKWITRKMPRWAKRGGRGGRRRWESGLWFYREGRRGQYQTLYRPYYE